MPDRSGSSNGCEGQPGTATRKMSRKGNRIVIYVLTYAMICPGTALGQISGLFENAFTDIKRAEKEFDNLELTGEYFRKELWVIEPGGKRKLLKHDKFREEKQNSGT